MAQPQPAEDGEDDIEEEDDIEMPPEGDDPFDGEESADVDLAATDIGEEVTDDDSGNPGGGSGGSDPFDGFEDASDEFGDGSDSSGDFAGAEEAFQQADEPIEDIINEGAARLSVVGLPETFHHGGERKTKADMEQEFQEVFEKFRLGHYGGEVADEYLFVDEDVDPLWGFAASAVACAALVIWMRPDGDELVDKLTGKVSDTDLPGMSSEESVEVSDIDTEVEA